MLATVERSIIFLMLAVSVTINVLLAGEIRRVRAEPAPRPRPVAIGTSVAPLQVTDLRGEAKVIDFGKPTILYFLSPSCRACARNAANMIALTEQVAAQYRVVGLAGRPNGLDEYLISHPMPFPIYIASTEVIESLALQSIPQTVVIDEAGTILHKWSGAYNEVTLKTVEQYFGVALPGLSVPVTASTEQAK